MNISSSKTQSTENAKPPIPKKLYRDNSEERVYVDWKRNNNNNSEDVTFDVIKEGQKKPETQKTQIMDTLRAINSTLQETRSVGSVAVTNFSKEMCKK